MHVGLVIQKESDQFLIEGFAVALINAHKELQNILIFVQDTGVGIPEDAMPNIFKPMFTTKSKGQGFGLVVVKRLTETLGGNVSFESDFGKGTKFIICLPI